MGESLAQRAVEVRLQDLPLFDPEGWRVITVLMQKGGVGKTATSGGLAVQLSDAGVPVVMIDLCHTGALTASFGLTRSEDPANIGTLMLGQWDGSIYDLAIPVRKNLWLIPASIDTVTMGDDLVMVRYREQRLRAALDDETHGPLPKRVVVIIDCPPVLNLVTDNAAVACAKEKGGEEQYGGLLLTPELLESSMETLDLLYAQMDALSGGGHYTMDTLGWFASLTDGTNATRRGRELIEKLPLKALGEMPRRTNIRDARDLGRPLLDAFPKLDANDIHRALAKQVRRKLNV